MQKLHSWCQICPCCRLPERPSHFKTSSALLGFPYHQTCFVLICSGSFWTCESRDVIQFICYERTGAYATAPAFAPAPGLGGAVAAFLAPAPRGARSRRGDADKVVSSYSVGGGAAPVTAPKLAPAAAPNRAPAAAPKLVPAAAPSEASRKRAAAPAAASGPAGQPRSGFTTLGSIFG